MSWAATARRRGPASGPKSKWKRLADPYLAGNVWLARWRRYGDIRRTLLTIPAVPEAERRLAVAASRGDWLAARRFALADAGAGGVTVSMFGILYRGIDENRRQTHLSLQCAIDHLHLPVHTALRAVDVGGTTLTLRRAASRAAGGAPSRPSPSPRRPGVAGERSFCTAGPDTEPVLRSGTATRGAVGILEPHFIIDPPFRASVWVSTEWSLHDPEFEVVESGIDRLDGFLQLRGSTFDSLDLHQSGSANQFDEPTIGEEGQQPQEERPAHHSGDGDRDFAWPCVSLVDPYLINAFSVRLSSSG